MIIKTICQQFDIPGQCKSYGLPLWQCPPFLFVAMGAINIAISIVTYALGARYVADPHQVSLIVVAITLVLFIITYTIVRGFERLAETNKLKSEFISIVSHQLRSPLSNLKWAIELLASGRLGQIEEKQAEYFRILEENTSRMGELVADLLTVSRIEQGSLPLHKVEFSLEDLAREVISKFEPYAKASNIEIALEAVNPLPQAFADSHQIKLASENLLDNAIRYTKGGGHVKVNIEKQNNKVFFKVEDSGVGIPQEDQKHIFQKFFRSGNVLKRQTQGSGLGLYIAKAVVEKCGGKMGFQSQEGKGSTFWFNLPIKD